MKWYRGYILLLVMVTLATASNRAFCQDDNQDAWLDSLARTIASMPDDSLKLRRIDSVAYYHTNIDTILKYSEWELQLSQKLGQPIYKAKANNYLGFAYYYKYNFDEAVDYYAEAVRICDSVCFKQGMAHYRHSLANAYAMLDDYVAANRLDCEALEYFKEIGDTLMLTETYRSLALINLDFQLANSAEEFIHEAMLLDSVSKNIRGICLNLYYLGRVERVRYDSFDDEEYLHNAIKYMQRALDFSSVDKYDEMHIYLEMMFLYISMAQIHEEDNGKYLESSRTCHHRAFVLAEELGVATDNRDFELWQAVYLAETGEFDDAYQIFKTMEANYVADSSHIYTEHYIDLFKRLGRFYELSGNYKSALEYYRKADFLHKRVSNREFAVETATYREDFKHQKENAMHIRHNEETRAKMRYAFLALASVIVLLVFLARSYVKNKRTNKILLDSNAEIEMQRDQLKKVNDEITASIRYAQKIQEASLPQKEMLDMIFGDSMLFWKPLDIVSGDFYWVQQKGRFKFLAVGDCTGHGVPGAFMSMLGISSLNDIVFQIDADTWTPSAGALLDVLRIKIISSLRQSVENEEDTKDGIDIALCVFDTQKGEIHFCGAMRPMFVFSGDGMKSYSGDRMPVGVSFKQDLQFTDHIIKVCQGDTVYLFTDGVVDQFGYVDGVETKFNRKRLSALLSQIHTLPFSEQQERVEAVFERWAASRNGHLVCPQVDDQLMIGVRIG